MSGCSLTLAPPTSFPPNPISCSKYTQHHRHEIITPLRKCKTINQITPIHAQVIKTGHSNDPFIIFELLRICFKCNSIDYAFSIFHQTPNPNVFLYTALIDGLVLHGFYVDSVRLYHQMVENCILPDNYVIVSVLKACGIRLDLKKGREIHGQAVKLGLISARSVRLKVMELYGKCGEFDNAERVLDEMSERDVVVLTVMISSYLDHGLVEKAGEVFDSVRGKDTVCWTAMIDGLVKNGEMNKALELFRRMQREGVRANEVTIVCILSACAQLGALEVGEWLHSYVRKYDIELNHLVGSALVNMYSRCGSIDEAERVFECVKGRDVTTYNSMISGFALNGKSVEAVEMLQRMIKEGIRPNNVTFVGVLNACSHGGMVELGYEIFQSMTTEHGVELQIEHYGCMVDLLGRVGHLEEAYNLIRSMKIVPDHIIWGSLLNACKIHKNFELGERVAKELVESGNADSGNYALLSNFYASFGKWEDAARVRSKLKVNGIQKEPGCSSIEVNNEIHEFLLGDIRHPEREAIYKKLKEVNQILKSEGYSPETDSVLQDIDEQKKEWALAIHSERLAICYGLISTKPHTTLRVVKNLRVCDDCHTAIKLISKLARRKIVLRDRNRFHHFENGSCSCGDFW